VLIGVRYPIQHVFRRKERAKIGGAHLIAEADLIVELALSVEVLRELGAILDSFHPEMVIFPMSGVLRGFPSTAYIKYASTKTLVRPCSSKKSLISKLETGFMLFVYRVGTI